MYNIFSDLTEFFVCLVECIDAQVKADGELDHPLGQEFWCNQCPPNYIGEGNRQVCAGILQGLVHTQRLLLQ